MSTQTTVFRENVLKAADKKKRGGGEYLHGHIITKLKQRFLIKLMNLS